MTVRRFTAPAACLAALLLALAIVPLARPDPAEAIDIPAPCDVPGVSVVCGAAGDVAGAAAGAAGDAVLGQLSAWVGDGAAWLLRQVAEAIDSTTAIDLSAPWFESHYGFMFQVGAILLLPLVLLTVLQALLRQDAGLLIRVGLLYLPAAMLFTGLAVAVSQTAIAVVDALSADLTGGVARDTDALARSLTQASALGGSVPLFASFLMALVMALAAIFVWFELLLRAGVVYVAMMFLPLFLATMIWPATSGWVRRLVQLIVAAILSKLVIVATLSLGLSALASGDGVAAVLAGAGMFLIAAFSPFVIFSLIPLAADVAQPQREGRHALAATTGTSLAWSVARTRMSFGAMGASAAPRPLGASGIGLAGPRGGSGPPGPLGGGASNARPPGGAPPGATGGGGSSAPSPAAAPAAGPRSTVAPASAAPAAARGSAGEDTATRRPPPPQPYRGAGDGI